MGSKGDPRVHVVMNLVLSFFFSWVVVAGMDLAGVSEFSWETVGYATAALFMITWLVVMR